MEYIRVTEQNLDSEHICCAISNNKDCQVIAKKQWLSDRFQDGLVFLKGNVRGKCFIEYIPAEKAWVPIEAPGYMYIDCFWISGQFKGQGYANELLEKCITDSKEKGMKGICVLSSQKKKMPYLSDPKFLEYKGFKTADTAEPFFALMYLPFDADAQAPRFGESVKHPCVPEDGMVIYYTSQCPYTAKYVPLLEAAAAENGIKLKTVHHLTVAGAQNSPSPYTAFSFFKDGKFVTNEILTQQKLLKYAAE